MLYFGNDLKTNCIVTGSLFVFMAITYGTQYYFKWGEFSEKIEINTGTTDSLGSSKLELEKLPKSFIEVNCPHRTAENLKCYRKSLEGSFRFLQIVFENDLLTEINYQLTANPKLEDLEARFTLSN